MERICRHEFDAQALVTKYPAQLSNRNKAIVFEISSPRGATHSGTISFTRWRQMPLPETRMRGPHLECGASARGQIARATNNRWRTRRPRPP